MIPMKGIYRNSRLGTGETLGDARRVFSDDSFFLKITHPSKGIFEGKIRLGVVMVKPKLFIFQLRLRVM